MRLRRRCSRSDFGRYRAALAAIALLDPASSLLAARQIAYVALGDAVPVTWASIARRALWLVLRLLEAAVGLVAFTLEVAHLVIVTLVRRIGALRASLGPAPVGAPRAALMPGVY